MFNIAFVLPSDRFAERIVSIFNEHNQYEADLGIAPIGEYACQVYCVEQPTDIFKSEFEADVLVARGFMANQLKDNYLGIPVVGLPILGNELLFALDIVRRQYVNKTIGVVGSDNMITDAEQMGEILGLKARSYLRKSSDMDSANRLVDQAAQDGCEVIISGYNTNEYARSIGLEAVMFESGHQSIWLAITEAKRVVNIIRTEHEKALRIKAILDYAYEGIVAIDSSGTVTMMNGQAGRLLGLRPADMIGKAFDQVVTDSPFSRAVRTKGTYVNEVMSYLQTHLAVNKVPLVDHGEIVGNVITFQDITKIQEAEGKIRDKIYSLGHIARFTFDDVIGTSSQIQATVDIGRRFAKVNSNILMIGETGTGKELFAQSIHNDSGRKSGPFVAINCAALPENLLESELFGYVEGAFTGAAKAGKPGLFELAHRGTIFLDEISDLPPKLQGRLLRVLQERNIMRLGHDRVVSVDVRIIAATNRDLGQLTANGEFRDDLFFRLNVLKMELPPLRDRIDDVRDLTQHFVRRYAAEFNKSKMTVDDEAISLMEQMEWSGNVRELQNVCERLVVLCDRPVITKKDVLSAVSEWHQPWNRTTEKTQLTSPLQKERSVDLPDQLKYKKLKDERLDLEHQRITDALEKFDDNKVQAARHLGISRTTLWRRRKELDPDREDHKEGPGRT